MPFPATVDDVITYAADRQAKHFNGVLLMTIQPDMKAHGPRGRNVDDGFENGFDDLSEGRLTKINVEYCQYLDKISEVLIDHGITPMLPPVFHGYGWKGLDVAGPVVPPDEYGRYCRYLVARYGARPGVYLVGGAAAVRSQALRPAAWRSTPGTRTTGYRNPLPTPPPERRTPRRRVAGLPVLPNRAYR